MFHELLNPDWDSKKLIHEISIEEIAARGIKTLILDVDGTILPRSQKDISTVVINWIEQAKKIFNIYLLSNNPSKNRIKKIAMNLNLDYEYRASKPRSKKINNLIRKHDLYNLDEIAIVGDRIFTDVICGNRINIYTILVRPISIKTQFINFDLQKLELFIAQILKNI